MLLQLIILFSQGSQLYPVALNKLCRVRFRQCASYSFVISVQCLNNLLVTVILFRNLLIDSHSNLKFALQIYFRSIVYSQYFCNTRYLVAGSVDVATNFHTVISSDYPCFLRHEVSV
jgi:hypothetical protein